MILDAPLFWKGLDVALLVCMARDQATHARILPTINHGNPQSGSRAAKEAMVRGQVIKSAFCSHPIFNSSIRRAEN